MVVVCFLIWQIIVFVLRSFHKSKFQSTIRNKHVLITGGSKGLGLKLACAFANLGANVTIMARNKNTLKEAKEKIETQLKSAQSTVATVSLDVTNLAAVQEAIRSAESQNGSIDLLIPCAGQAITGYFSKHPVDNFRKSMELNYFGVLHVVKTVAPGMMERQEGSILFVTSTLALCAFMGYSCYTPTKYAVRGLSDTLRNELKPYNIRIAIAYPPGMRTPGFEVENKTKPAECQAIEDGETVYEPKDVANSIINSFAAGDYHISCGDFGTNVLSRLVGGIQPRSNLITDMLLLPLLAIVSKVYVWLWDSEVCKVKYEGIRPSRF